MSNQAKMATAIINQIIGMQSVEDQRQVVLELFQRYALPESETYEIMTDHEVAERYNVHVNTVREWLASEQLKGFKEAKKWYSRTDWLREFEDSKVSSAGRIRKRFAKVGG